MTWTSTAIEGYLGLTGHFLTDAWELKKKQIYGVLFHENITKIGDKLDTKDTYWEIIEDILPILVQLSKITEVLGKESELIGSSVYVLIKNLLHVQNWGIMLQLKIYKGVTTK